MVHCSISDEIPTPGPNGMFYIEVLTLVLMFY